MLGILERSAIVCSPTDSLFRRGGMSLTELEGLFCVPRRIIRCWCYDILGPTNRPQASSKSSEKGEIHEPNL